MAQVIEFETLARFTPTVKWTPNHQRGKVIPFISQRKALYKPVCAAYEELDSESSRWPDRDEALYRASLEYAQPLMLEEEPLLENSSNINGEELFGSSYWACSPTVAHLDHETGMEYLFQPAHFTVSCFVLDERHERYQSASHRTGCRRIQWRKRPDLASAIG